MFGNNPYRPALTHQPRGEFAMSQQDAVNVMDELVLVRTQASAAGQALATAWSMGRATIRDMAHAGGPDSRIHITVLNHLDGYHYHVPACWDRVWVLDSPDGVTR
jgi:hypothetical protein